MRSYFVLMMTESAAEASITERAMETAGLSCICGWANSTKHALKLLDQLTPDFILLDEYISSLDSLSFLSEIKSSPRLKDIPVVLCCHRIAKNLKDQALQLGACALVQKTNKEKQFGEALIGAMEGRSEVELNPEKIKPS